MFEKMASNFNSLFKKAKVIKTTYLNQWMITFPEYKNCVEEYT